MAAEVNGGPRGVSGGRSVVTSLEMRPRDARLVQLSGVEFQPLSGHKPAMTATRMYHPRMRRARASSRSARFALAFALAMALAAMTVAAQRDTILTNGRNLQIPINHGMPDKPFGFTF